jgi:hypothetical protein
MNPAVITTSLSLDKLRERNMGAWLAAIDHAHGGSLDPGDAAELEALGLVQSGVMHDLTAEAIRQLHPDGIPGGTR